MKILKLKHIFLTALAVLTVTNPLAAEKWIHINKETFQLRVLEDDVTIAEFPVCLGANFGQKEKEGDRKTPEGSFTVWMIQPSSEWDYDYGDGYGKRKGVYGPWFIRLKTPMSDHIGIHGTIFPETIGMRASEGCIRMRNEDLVKLKEHVKCGMRVDITADNPDQPVERIKPMRGLYINPDYVKLITQLKRNPYAK